MLRNAIGVFVWILCWQVYDGCHHKPHAQQYFDEAELIAIDEAGSSTAEDYAAIASGASSTRLDRVAKYLMIEDEFLIERKRFFHRLDNDAIQRYDEFIEVHAPTARECYTLDGLLMSRYSPDQVNDPVFSMNSIWTKEFAKEIAHFDAPMPLREFADAAPVPKSQRVAFKPKSNEWLITILKRVIRRR